MCVSMGARVKPGPCKASRWRVDNFLIRTHDRVIRYLGASLSALSALPMCTVFLPYPPVEIVMTPSVVVQSSQLSVPSLRRDWGAISSFSCSLHLDTRYLLRHAPYPLTSSREDSKRIQSAYLQLQRARTGYVYVYTLAIRGVELDTLVGAAVAWAP
jgi:hypothetical protein